MAIGETLPDLIVSRSPSCTMYIFLLTPFDSIVLCFSSQMNNIELESEKYSRGWTQL